MTNKDKPSLNARELQIVAAMKANKSLNDLAKKMRLTVRTVQHYYLQTLMMKLACTTASELHDEIKKIKTSCPEEVR